MRHRRGIAPYQWLILIVGVLLCAWLFSSSTQLEADDRYIERQPYALLQRVPADSPDHDWLVGLIDARTDAELGKTPAKEYDDLNVVYQRLREIDLQYPVNLASANSD